MNERDRNKYIISLIDLIIDNYYRNVDLHEMKSEYKRINFEYRRINGYEKLPRLKKILDLNIYYFIVAFFLISVHLVYNVFNIGDELLLHYIPLFFTLVSIPLSKFVIMIIHDLNEKEVLKRLKLVKVLLMRKL